MTGIWTDDKHHGSNLSKISLLAFKSILLLTRLLGPIPMNPRKPSTNLSPPVSGTTAIILSTCFTALYTSVPIMAAAPTAQKIGPDTALTPSMTPIASATSTELSAKSRARYV
uniref:Uncharacterized protein n=1 Tax=Romanomermis culicivorax TaxID=13658 RepID=A0A915K9N3_ROMCU